MSGGRVHIGHRDKRARVEDITVHCASSVPEAEAYRRRYIVLAGPTRAARWSWFMWPCDCEADEGARK